VPPRRAWQDERVRGSRLLTAVSAAFWSAFALIFAAQVLWDMRTHGHSPVRMCVYMLVVWNAWTLLTPVVARLARRFPLAPFAWRSLAAHVLAALVLTTLHIAFWIEATLLLRPFDSRGITMFWDPFVGAIAGRMLFELVVYAVIVGAAAAFDFYVRAAEAEGSLARARLHALELQMQPHFLFNTLHAIGGLVRQSRNGEAVEMIAGLSDLLRYSLDSGGDAVPLEREIAMLRRYLDIQRLRFADRLTVRIDVADDIRRAAVPALILQPLAENAVRHGIEPLAAPGVIELRARRDGDRLRIDICNSGRLAATPRDGLGIANTSARLAQRYGARQSFELAQRGDGVVASLSLPLELVP
jgi:two-component system, LytTR family, sensor kinase